MLTWLRGRGTTARTASKLYGSIVTQARNPAFYRGGRVPDTLDGRYGVLVVHVWLALAALRRVGPEGSDLARALVEAFVIDIDDNMREIGVGDLSVPKKVKKAAAGLYDRTREYDSATVEGDRAALAGALGRHVAGDEAWIGGPALARYVEGALNLLTKTPSAALLAGEIDFPEPAFEDDAA